MGRARLFVAAWPPPDAVADLEMLPRKPRPGVRFVEPSQWHVTLAFLGNAERGETLDAFGRLSLPAADAIGGPIVELLGDHSLILPVRGIEELAAQVGRGLRGIGDARRPRRFVGHLTLARLDRRARRFRHPLVGFPISVAFPVGEVALVESRLRPDGANYETLASIAVDDGVVWEP